MTLLDRLSTGWKAWILLFLITFGAAAPGVFLLPALDRDESRFAQASKQMLEDHDYIRIQYQDELRNKKPAGIHWLQAASTAAFTGAEAKQIWTYRVPSWLGAAFGTLACFWCGIALIGRRDAFVGAALFGSTLLLTSESHISKTDGMLVFLTTLSIGALARLYMENRFDKDHDNLPAFKWGEAVRGWHQTRRAKLLALLFWFCMGASFLIKGPVTPMVAAYAGVGAFVWAKLAGEKEIRWTRILLWWPGPLIFVAMVLPWFLWIQAATDGQYVKGAVGKDLKDKFAGASEGHGGWPLYHLSHIPAWFFPATLLIVPGLVAAWQKLRGQQGDARLMRGAYIAAGLFAGLAVASFLVSFLPDPFSLKLMSAYPALLLAVFWWLSSQSGWVAAGPTAYVSPDSETKGLRMIAAWGLLTYAFFELMPTLLSHYILPAYPAFGLLCGYAAVKMIDGANMPIARWISIALFSLGAIILLAASFPGVTTYVMAETAGDFKTVSAGQVLDSWTPYRDFPVWLWWAGFVLTGGALIEFARFRSGIAIALGIAASIAIGWHIRIFMLPSQVWVQPTETARIALVDVCGLPGENCGEPGQSGGLTLPPSRILALGYAEPSYVLTLGTQNLHPPETPLELPRAQSEYPVVYLINFEDRKAEPSIIETVSSLRKQADDLNLCVTESRPFYALNYSNGDPVNFKAMRFDLGDCSR